jgi:hypothetical protein
MGMIRNITIQSGLVVRFQISSLSKPHTTPIHNKTTGIYKKALSIYPLSAWIREGGGMRVHSL